MKLLGLTCGRKMGNSEILLKEALMAAEELGGIDVEIIRLMDLNVKPCTGCEGCIINRQKGGPGDCVLKDDDMDFLMEKVMESDGVILAAPVYVVSPPGYLKVIIDRMARYGANIVVDSAMKGKKDEKTRPGGLISVGGGDLSWVAMGLSLMVPFTFLSLMKIVDQLQAVDAGRRGQVLVDETTMEKARKLGRNVAEAMGKPYSEVKYKGDDPGVCPVCHSNLLLVTKKLPVECPICGIQGTLKIDGDEITVNFTEEEQKRSRCFVERAELHLFHEIPDNMKAYEQKKDEILAKLGKYKSYKSYSLPGWR